MTACFKPLFVPGQLPAAGGGHLCPLFPPRTLTHTAHTTHNHAHTDLAAYANTTWLASGWGTTSEGADYDGSNGRDPDKLQYGLMNYVPNCQITKATPEFVCAGRRAAVDGGDVPFQDSCQGEAARCVLSVLALIVLSSTFFITS